MAIGLLNILLALLLSLEVSCVKPKSMDKNSNTCDFVGTAADAKDCTAYYHCTGGTLYHYQCGVASVFDDKLLTCVSPARGHHCDKAKAIPQTNNKHDRFLCPYDGYFPDPTDCRRFYRCLGHTKHAFSCPTGMGFNSDKIECEPIENVLQCGLEGFLSSSNKVKKVKNLMLRELSKGLNQLNINTRTKQPESSNSNRNSHFGDNGRQDSVSDIGRIHSGNPYTDPFYINKKQAREEINYRESSSQSKPFFNEPIKIDDRKSWQKDFEHKRNILLHDKTKTSFNKPIQIDNRKPWGIDYYVDDPDLAEEDHDLDMWRGHQSGPFYTNLPDSSHNTRYSWKNPRQPRTQKSNARDLRLMSLNRNYRRNRAEVNPEFRKRIRFEQNRHQFLLPRYKDPPRLSDEHLRRTKPTNGNKENKATRLEVKPEIYPNFNNQYGKEGGDYLNKFKNYNSQQADSDSHLNLNLARPFRCPYDGYFADNDDCTRFFHCTHGIPYLVQCNGGLFFNPVNKICDWPARVAECSNDMRKVFVAPRPVRLDDWHSGDSDSGMNTAENKEQSVSKREKEGALREKAIDASAIDLEVVDTCSGRGYMRNKNDCSKFYFCTDTEKIEYSCGAHMAFDNALRTCVNAQDVADCAK